MIVDAAGQIPSREEWQYRWVRRDEQQGDRPGGATSADRSG